MNVKRELQRLYDAIPGFQCKPGCQDCCGPVPFSRTEWNRIADKRTTTARKTPSLTCPYAVDGKCECYEHRPFVCRLFGTVTTEGSLMRCPHGCHPENPFTEEEADRLMGRYIRLQMIEERKAVQA